MALKSNKESPSGSSTDPEAKQTVIVSEPTKSDADKNEKAKSAKSEGGSSGGGSKSSGDGKSGGGGGGKKDGGSSKKKQGETGNPIAEAQQFLKEVLIEFRKISWPEFRQVVKETWSVLFLVAVITLMVLGFDWILGHAIFGPLEHFARMHGGGIGRG